MAIGEDVGVALGVGVAVAVGMGVALGVRVVSGMAVALGVRVAFGMAVALGVAAALGAAVALGAAAASGAGGTCGVTPMSGGDGSVVTTVGVVTAIERGVSSGGGSWLPDALDAPLAFSVLGGAVSLSFVIFGAVFGAGSLGRSSGAVDLRASPLAVLMSAVGASVPGRAVGLFVVAAVLGAARFSTESVDGAPPVVEPLTGRFSIKPNSP